MVRTVRSCAIVYAFALNDESLSRRVVPVQSIRDYAEIRGLSRKRNLASPRSAEKYAESGSVKRVSGDPSASTFRRSSRKGERGNSKSRSNAGARRVASSPSRSSPRRGAYAPYLSPPLPLPGLLPIVWPCTWLCPSDYHRSSVGTWKKFPSQPAQLGMFSENLGNIFFFHGRFLVDS